MPQSATEVSAQGTAQGEQPGTVLLAFSPATYYLPNQDGGT